MGKPGIVCVCVSGLVRVLQRNRTSGMCVCVSVHVCIRERKQDVYACVCVCIRQRELPDSSVAKESACNAGDPSSFPGSGRCAGEGIGYPLQYCWASLVAQLVKNPPAMRETWVQSLGWEDPLEKGKATHSSILAWRIPTVHGVTKSQT